jgi:hypothetical protein
MRPGHARPAGAAGATRKTVIPYSGLRHGGGCRLPFKYISAFIRGSFGRHGVAMNRPLACIVI